MTAEKPVPLDEEDEWHDDPEDADCSSCGGEGFEECDDPIQCLSPSCDGEYHRCQNCGGSGRSKDQRY